MKKEKVRNVEIELDRMEKAIEQLKKTQNVEVSVYDSGQYTAAVRRASTDLSRALTRLRNS